MSEMRHIKCPSCECDNVPRAVIDGMSEYRCRACGLVFYGPCGCDIDHTQKVEKTADDSLLGDWQTASVVVPVEGASGVKRYPGCS